MEKLLVITCGGTFDKEYGTGAGVQNFTFGESPAARRILHRARADGIYVTVCLKKDSLEMTNQDRELVRDLCVGGRETRIVITHGTDTMIETAKLIANTKIGKTIVITGSSQPAAMRETDADFNLGFALGVARVAGHGVYIAMNGKVFRSNEVKKNPKTGVFEKI